MKDEPPKTRDNGELKECVPHLYYLADQASAFLLITERQDVIVRNALLESSLLSLRNIHEFFAVKGGRGNDFKAYQWSDSRYAGVLDEDEKTDIDQYLAHLTTRRKEHKTWENILNAKVPKARAEIAIFLKVIESKLI
jgi:hypothetical protein